MSSEEFVLAWDNHCSTLVGVFEKLLDSSSLVDCTLAAEGQYLKAHKLVLSACSPYFELLFNQENEKNPIIILKDVKFRELKAMIEFMYRGRVEIPEDRLGDFVDVAESLQIKGLGGDPEKNNAKRKIVEISRSFRRGKNSPVSRKRRRSSSSSDGENANVFSPELEVIDESNSCESGPRHSTSEDTHHSPPSVLSPSVASDRSRTTVPKSHVKEEVCGARSKLSSFDQPTVSSVKTEPEPELVPDIYEPETVCLIEPKIEEGDEDTSPLDHGGVRGISGDVHSQDSSNHYNVFPHLLDTVEAGSNDSFHIGHMPEHTDIRGAASTSGGTKAQACPECGERVAAGQLAMHLLQHPARAASLTCPECGAVFAEARQLHTHLRRHPGLRPFRCQLCAKAFTRAVHLQTHLRVHAGERPYACRVCGSAFFKSGDLKTHQRIHTGERPFACAECGKAFTKSTHLQTHLKTHTGERPYKCGRCDKAFTRAVHLQTHLRLHEAEYAEDA